MNGEQRIMNGEQRIMNDKVSIIPCSTFLVPCSIFYQILTLKLSGLYILSPGFILNAV